MESMDSRGVTQILAKAVTRRDLVKRLGVGALAAAVATRVSNVARANPGAPVTPWVLASGVSTMPASELVWRFVADVASPIGQGESLERALGFAMATAGPLRIFDDSAGTEMHLQVGESEFVP